MAKQDRNSGTRPASLQAWRSSMTPSRGAPALPTQAAIAADHDEAPTAAGTGLATVQALYELLMRIADNPGWPDTGQ